MQREAAAEAEAAQRLGDAFDPRPRSRPAEPQDPRAAAEALFRKD
jgi:hypothetical protein